MRIHHSYIGLLALAMLLAGQSVFSAGETRAQPSLAPAGAEAASRGQKLAKPQPERSALILESVESRPADHGLDMVLSRWLELDPGDAITPEVLLLARERLLSSGYFKELQIYTARGSRPGRVVVVVEASLDRSAHLETGFGYDPMDGWYLNLIGVRWNNPSRRGGFLRAGGSLGLRTGGIYADWLRPSTVNRLDLVMNARLGSQRWIAWVDDTQFRQKLERNRLAIGLGRIRTRGMSALLWLGYEAARPDSILEEFGGQGQISVGGAIPDITQTQNLWQMQLDLSFDERDDSIAPRHGKYLGGRVRAGLVDGDHGYLRVQGDARRFLPMPAHSVLGLRLHGGWANSKTPYYERFIFGGVDNVRGFPDASLSGPRGATAFWAINVEWRVPVLRRAAQQARIEGILFVDGGSHWNADGDSQPGALGVGYGLRVRLPWVQRIGIDVGIPLTTTPTGDPFWVSLSLGYTF